MNISNLDLGVLGSITTMLVWEVNSRISTS